MQAHSENESFTGLTPELTPVKKKFKAYNIQNYRDIQQNIKKQKMGGLGPNMNKKWKKANKLRRDKKLYAQRIQLLNNQKFKSTTMRKSMRRKKV